MIGVCFIPSSRELEICADQAGNVGPNGSGRVNRNFHQRGFYMDSAG